MSSIKVAVSRIQKSSLKELEAVIARGLSTFVEVGQALQTINEDERYKEARYSTWEKYLEEQWGISRSRGYQLIGTAKTYCILSLSNKLDTLPGTEKHVHPLLKLIEPDQLACWKEVVKTAPRTDAGKPIITAKFVESVAKKYRHKAGLTGCRDVGRRRFPGRAYTDERPFSL